MKIISVILLVMGLILGPGYLFYSSHFSGSSINKVTVFSQDIKRFKTGSLQSNSSSKRNWNVPVVLDLDPQMNPISINASIKYTNPPILSSKYFLKYKVKLKHGDQEIWNTIYSKAPKNKHKTNGGGSTTSYRALHTFSVLEAGKYSLDVQQIGRSKTIVSYIDFDIRRNVTFANMKIMILGIMLIMASGIGFYLSQRK